MTNTATVNQAVITRALKAAAAAGLTVAEIVATRDGVRMIMAGGAGANSGAANPWDEVLADQAGKAGGHGAAR